MDCPKCGNMMEKVSHESIEIDRCVLCKGIWFDMLEHEQLKAIKGSESIDIGDPEVGELFNRESDVDCPVCHTKMIPMVDRDQPHIWYEACTVCYGVFFDAGEFKDYKEQSILDFFRGLRAGERT